jgi:hypothetical protein
MQATSTFATYQAGPEMNEFDITSYFDLATASQQGMQASEDAIIANMSEADLAAASPEEMQACEDIIMAGMCEAAIMADMSAADAMAVSSQPQYSSTIGVNDLPIYVYTEFGERYILTPEQQQEAIAAAEFEAFLSEINLLAKQQSSLELLGKLVNLLVKLVKLPVKLNMLLVKPEKLTVKPKKLTVTLRRLTVELSSQLLFRK